MTRVSRKERREGKGNEAGGGGGGEEGLGNNPALDITFPPEAF